MAPAEAERSKASPGDKQTMAAADRSVLSPRFRSAAAMAGWDEEALLAGLIVEDTPVRDSKQRKRLSKTPSSGSKRKRRSQRRSPSSVPMAILSLDDEDSTKEENAVPGEKNNGELVEVPSTSVEEEPKADAEAVTVVVGSDKNQPATAAIPCMDRLREELSCAICLDICFEPSTTPCGHSFCLKCLKCAASKCGKRCPKCRDLISNARSCTVNTVLWNTIQLLFPEEIEARRKKPSSPKPPTATKAPPPQLLAASRHSAVAAAPNRSAFILSSELVSEAEIRRNRRRRPTGGRVSPSQLEDAALALRLQREEFMGSVAERREPVLRRSSSIQSARDQLRALASRAVQVRTSSRF